MKVNVTFEFDTKEEALEFLATTGEHKPTEVKASKGKGGKGKAKAAEVEQEAAELPPVIEAPVHQPVGENHPLIAEVKKLYGEGMQKGVAQTALNDAIQATLGKIGVAHGTKLGTLIEPTMETFVAFYKSEVEKLVASLVQAPQASANSFI